MNIQYNQFKKLDSFLVNFFPQLDFNHKELNRENCERLLHYLVIIVDTLVKGENLYKKRNLILPEGRSFFHTDIVDRMMNINLYLYKFDTFIFNFTRTERQTFIFIIENIIDYFKRGRYYVDKKDLKSLFIDYRFWVENFLKMFNQKIIGSIYSSKKLNLKNFFHSSDSINNELIYSNPSVSFSISPFAISRDNKNLFLSQVTDGQLIYADMVPDDGKETVIRNAKYDFKIYEFLFSNFDFDHANPFKRKLKNERHVLMEKAVLIETACNYHKQRLFMDSYNLLKDLPFEITDLPLVYLLQIKNLVNINRLFEVKKLMQKFVTLYPYYADGYEIMGDIHLKEEDFEMALNFYEKALKITQNKRVADKLKKVREAIEKNREKTSKQKNENFYDITEHVFHHEEKLLRREKELRQMVEILLADSRRNVLLVGESGVGKSALIRLLTAEILNGDVPPPLRNLRLKEINFVSLLTGSKYRGQFEEKVLKLFNDFKSQPAILVLEDVHLMISTGAPRGTSLDLVNILKQFLREKSIQVIATTSYEEYKNTIEKDNTLMGFIQKVTVNEMSTADTRKILRNLAEDIFSGDKIIVSEEIIDQILESAKRDVRDKKCPEAAVMILERAVSKVKYKTHMDELNKFQVEPADVAEVLSDMLNLPESNLPISLKQRLIHLKDNLLEEIVGQDEAIERMTAAVITAKLDYDTKKNRPDGVFLFIGPTGVGKTESALALSRTLYGSEDYLIRIDMSEYMERFTYSRFVGAAPGYVGYMDTNQLTDKVRQNPFSIILLDEIEKADSQLLNIFLQVFDAGRLTDARGNVVDFSHTTIIMTSNIGTSLFSKTQMGYQSDLKGSHVSHATLLKALKKYFSPEFLNRVDEILIFNHLKEEDIKKIIDIQLKATREQLEKQDKEMVISDEVMDYIIREGYSREYGARHISRTIRKQILEKIAHLSLEKDWDYSRQVVCSVDKEEDQVVVQLESVGIETVDDGKFIEGVNVE
ncbi:MAG: AAA family ATPase [Candidatus Aminicenantes bacterium]|nr:MAG: AAA family ATPase [Candidatus Aminicenantes bacterium]